MQHARQRPGEDPQQGHEPSEEDGPHAPLLEGAFRQRHLLGSEVLGEAPAQPLQQRLHRQGAGHQQRGDADPAHARAVAFGLGHGEGVLEVDDAGDLVDAVAVDREAGQARGAGQVEHVGRGGRVHQGADLHPGGHDVLGRQIAQREGADEEVGGVLFEGAGLGRMADQGEQLAGGPGGGHLLGRFHAERPHEAVGHGVETGDDRTEGAGEGVLGAGDEAGHLERPGDRPVLRDELADDHLDGGGEQHADDDGDAGDGSLRQAGRRERPGQQCGEGGLGEHADHEGGDGDAELGAGELEGQLP